MASNLLVIGGEQPTPDKMLFRVYWCDLEGRSPVLYVWSKGTNTWNPSSFSLPMLLDTIGSDDNWRIVDYRGKTEVQPTYGDW